MARLPGIALLTLGLWFTALSQAAEYTRLMDPSTLTRLREEAGARLVILDARDADAYRQGHVPGALNLPAMQAFSREDGTFLLPPVKKLQAMLRSAGVDNDSLVVVYDAGENILAARLIWMLDLLGHEDNRLLNGGLYSWLQAGLPLEKGERTASKQGNFVPSVQPERLVSKLTVRLAMEHPGFVLVDVRSREEYTGQRKQPDVPRAGHIPGARNLPWTRNLVDDDEIGPIKPLEALQRLYGDLPRDRRIIAYCHIGSHATMAYLLLRELDYEVAVYDGSWYEWSRDPRLPAATGGE